ncbi:MAG: hypothetical protein WCC03_08515 [Candidatus Acidiferrales bacterium]
MAANPQSAYERNATYSRARRCLSLLFLLLACLTPCFAPLCAQQSAPPGTIGRVEGNDVSIEGGSAASNGTATSAPSMFVVNGSVITVHSGQAHMTLAGGGEIDICGPAKFTLLQSGPAITLALNFGRMRVQLPAAAQLRIFTPTIVATPIDIGGAPRDFTVGLDLSDSLCVVATSGALRLEHQFTGEGLIVPQSGEFFLAAGKLLPVAGVSGSCQCVSLQARNAAPAPPSQPLPRSPEMGLTSRPQPEPPPVPEVASNPPVLAQPELPPPAEVHAAPPAIQIRQLAAANELHPNPQAPANEVPDAPALSIPIYKVVMPPLTFSANAPAPPGEPSTDMILLVRIAHVQPEWQFKGRVEAPQLEQVSAREPSRSPSAPHSSQKKKGGFWAALKRAFGGGGDETQN